MYSIPLFLMPQIPDESTVCQNIYTLQGVFIIGHTRLHTLKLIHAHSEYVKKSGVSCLWLNTRQYKNIDNGMERINKVDREPVLDEV